MKSDCMIFFFFQAEDGIRDVAVTGVQTCALPISIEADKVSAGASPDEAASVLDQTEYVTGADAYQAWLQDRQDEAVERLDGVLFDIPPPLRRIEAVLARGSSSGAAYYTKPSEDLTRPGRTWGPLGGRGEADRYQTWSELSTVFHEGVPGHHLQAGAAPIGGRRPFPDATGAGVWRGR